MAINFFNNGDSLATVRATINNNITELLMRVQAIESLTATWVPTPTPTPLPTATPPPGGYVSCGNTTCLAGTPFDPTIAGTMHDAGDDSSFSQIVGLSSGAIYAPMSSLSATGDSAGALFVTQLDETFYAAELSGRTSPMFFGRLKDSIGNTIAAGFDYQSSARFIEGETVEFRNWDVFIAVDGQYTMREVINDHAFALCC